MNNGQIIVKIRRFFLSVLCMMSFCGYSMGAAQTASPYLMDLNNLKVPDTVQIVGLGEASHGVGEYQQMKLQVFKALVAQGNCRSFIIEGDFGGCLKVEEYIHGGSGTAKEAVSEIGFSIYCTEEMADLVTWMREYNESAAKGKDLHFYGMDMQRYDNNKAYLFKVLDEGAPQLSKTYQLAFQELTDQNRLTCDSITVKNGQVQVLKCIEAMDQQKEKITKVVGEEAFTFARECAVSIYKCSKLTESGVSYNTLRDSYMAEKVNWFITQGDGSTLFINGHNGHIGKTSANGYECLGKILAKQYGKAYFAIGTDALDTSFNSQTNTGFELREVKNSNDFTALAHKLGEDFYYLDFATIGTDQTLEKMIKKSQKLTALNVSLAGWQQNMSAFYTQQLIPMDTYNGIIVFQKVSPSTPF